MAPTPTQKISRKAWREFDHAVRRKLLASIMFGGVPPPDPSIQRESIPLLSESVWAIASYVTMRSQERTQRWLLVETALLVLVTGLNVTVAILLR